MGQSGRDDNQLTLTIPRSFAFRPHRDGCRCGCQFVEPGMDGEIVEHAAGWTIARFPKRCCAGTVLVAIEEP